MMNSNTMHHRRRPTASLSNQYKENAGTYGERLDLLHAGGDINSMTDEHQDRLIPTLGGVHVQVMSRPSDRELPCVVNLRRPLGFEGSAAVLLVGLTRSLKCRALNRKGLVWALRTPLTSRRLCMSLLPDRQKNPLNIRASSGHVRYPSR